MINISTVTESLFRSMHKLNLILKHLNLGQVVPPTTRRQERSVISSPPPLRCAPWFVRTAVMNLLLKEETARNTVLFEVHNDKRSTPWVETTRTQYSKTSAMMCNAYGVLIQELLCVHRFTLYKNALLIRHSTISAIAYTSYE